MAPIVGTVPHFIIPPTMIMTMFQVSHKAVGIQMDAGVHRIAMGTAVVCCIPYSASCLSQDSIEHFQRRWLGVINTSTTVPPRSEICVKRTGELAFESAEDATCLVLEVGVTVHHGRDGSLKRQWDCSAWSQAFVPAVNGLENAILRMLSGEMERGEKISGNICTSEEVSM